MGITRLGERPGTLYGKARGATLRCLPPPNGRATASPATATPAPHPPPPHPHPHPCRRPMAARSCWPARGARCMPPTRTASTWAAICGRAISRTLAATPALSAPCTATRHALCSNRCQLLLLLPPNAHHLPTLCHLPLPPSIAPLLPPCRRSCRQPLSLPLARLPAPFPTSPPFPPSTQIDMSTGQKVDTLLDGCVVCSDSQKQRTYKVYQDSDFIWWVLLLPAGCCCCQLGAGCCGQLGVGCCSHCSWWHPLGASAATWVLPLMLARF